MTSIGADSVGPTRSLVSKHVGLWLSTVAFAIVAIKLVSVSHGNMQTSLTIIGVGGWTAVPSLLLAMLPSIAVVALFVSILDLGERIRERDRVGALPYATAVLTVLVILVVPAWLVGVGLLFGLAFVGLGVVGRFVYRRHGERQTSFSFLGYLVITVTAGVFLAAASPKPWLALDEVYVGATQPVRGYVLGEQGEMTSILLDSERTILWVATSEVERRLTCLPAKFDRPVWALLFWPSEIQGTKCTISPFSI